MAFDKRGTFTLGKNKRKEKETHPDYSGTLTDENGVEYWLSAYIKEHNGEKFFSGRIKKKEQRGPAQSSGGGSGRLSDNLDQEIPF